MKRLHLVAVIAMAAFLSTLFSACSDEKSSQQQAAQPSQQQSQPAQTQANTQPAATASSQLPKNGKVIKAMHAGGYTYMQVEKDGKEFWIAGTMMNVKRDDYVRWADAAVMKNFSSSTLHKTFDEILFVTDVELDQ